MSKDQINIEELLKNIYDNKSIIEKERKEIDLKLQNISILENNLKKDNIELKQKEKELIDRQLAEIDDFVGKIDELIASGYNPTLDDGVGKNIAPLQERKMLKADVLNANQLKKYLKAEW